MTRETAAVPAPRRVRAVAVVVEDDQVLVIRRVKDARRYAVLPGGGVEHGESAETACLRELKEETGLIGTLLAPLIVDDASPDVRYFHVEAHGAPTLGGPEVERSHRDNVYSPSWIRLDDLPSVHLVPEDAHRAVRAAACRRDREL
ncbi:DNA mismatch repair protein MutT [Brachybacterium phenoliresistens]|uniref:DNA mismatch repair protein MutT n=1 Tax=Brachybacterium phenoliresistens TaxID=396014 RepID=Z9JPB7_9MICO|nr:NUDIX domain-containing protein [Brachybacterium phenoliresistens]EWS79631.1 DNA mismatch repair protein MutT [Brachybacterium phenoliresistens]